jgi:hypothetical protein
MVLSVERIGMILVIERSCDCSGTNQKDDVQYL